MKVRSVRFGEFEVGDEAVIHFPAGLAPFGKELDFVLLAAEEEGGWLTAKATVLVNGPAYTREQAGCLSSKRPEQGRPAGALEGQELAWLQSLQMPQLGFWVGHAGKLFPARDIGIEARHLQSVDVEHVEQLCIVLILTIEQEQVTANLLAPVLVNMEAGIGRQVVVAGSIEEVRVPVSTSWVAAEAV